MNELDVTLIAISSFAALLVLLLGTAIVIISLKRVKKNAAKQEQDREIPVYEEIENSGHRNVILLTPVVRETHMYEEIESGMAARNPTSGERETNGMGSSNEAYDDNIIIKNNEAYGMGNVIVRQRNEA